MKTFTFTFLGKHADEVCERFGAYFWDGGLDQTIEQNFLEDMGLDLDDVEFGSFENAVVRTDNAVCEQKGMDVTSGGLLDQIHAQTLRVMGELKWSDAQIKEFASQVNRAISRKDISLKTDDETDWSLVTHDAEYSGAFIFLGGWTHIYDKVIPAGQRGHELYLAFGGLGAGGWDGDCDIEIMTDGSTVHDGKRYSIPVNHYGKYDWEDYKTGFQWFHDNVKSFMFMYLPIFIQPIPVFVYFDGDSKQIGISVPNCSLSCGIGGGSVEVRK